MTAKRPDPSRFAHAIDLRITDPSLQGYLQRHPFASGPDPVLNAAALQAVSEHLAFRESAPPVASTLLSDEDSDLETTAVDRVRELMQAVNIPPADRDVYLNDFGWKVKRVPRSSRNVLVIGCGNGIELLFLRAVLPNAHITAVDYHDCLLPGVALTVGLDHQVGDMNVLLYKMDPRFDLVFSNHTIEHFYTPDETIALLAGLMTHGATFVSALPMCGCTGTLYLERVMEIAAANASDRPGKIHPLDAVFFDAGHPWKTTPSDLTATFKRAGFEKVTIFQRANHLCRPIRVNRRELENGRRRNKAEAMVLLPLRWFAKGLFFFGFRSSLPRWMFALERRLPFGTNNAYNRYSEEGLIFASHD